LEPVACGRLVERDEQHYFVYEYRLKSFTGYIDHDTIYVNARTGWLMQQEIRRQSLDEPEPGKGHVLNTFRVDPTLTIEPPKDAARPSTP
jgi:hypothetical protein